MGSLTQLCLEHDFHKSGKYRTALIITMSCSQPVMAFQTCCHVAMVNAPRVQLHTGNYLGGKALSGHSACSRSVKG